MTGTTIPHVTVEITEAINITDVTTGVIDGTGVLDKLLTTMTAHLTAQYEKRRITGVEYATLYLGAYQATLQQALALTLAKETQAYEIKNLDWEAKLKEAQYNLAVKQLEAATYELNTKTPIEVSNLTKQGILLAAEASQKAKDLEISTYELSTKLPAEVSGITKQNTLLDGQATLQTKDGTLKDLEATLVTAKTAGEAANTASTNKQTELYERKRLTEVAQLDGAGILPGSVLDSQRDLLDAQTLGLERDAKQKVAKQMLDAWVARSTINDVADPSFVNKIRDQEVGAAVTALFASINLSMPPQFP